MDLDATAAEEIAARFGLGDGARFDGPVARGELGQVWRLTTAHGTWAVKQPFDRPLPAEVEADTRYQEAALAAGVPMPAPVRALDGGVVVAAGATHVRVYEWVDLLPVDRGLDPVVVGETVARIHRVEHHGGSGVHVWYTDPVGAQAWDALVRDAAAGGAPFAEQLAAHREELVALEALLEPPANLQTCHRDLFADNVLGTPRRGICVIDWENSGLADPSQELAMVLFEFADRAPHRARALSNAYRDAGGPGRVTRPEHFSMIIAVLGHLGALSCHRWLDPARAHERDRNEARVDEFLEVPLTMASLVELLDAAR